MQVEIKLYGHLVCLNEKLKCLNLNKFKLEVPEDTVLSEIHRLIFVNPLNNLVTIVDGHTQRPDYALKHSCNISIFPPMGGRTHNPFEKI